MSKKLFIFFAICVLGIVIYATAGHAAGDYGLGATAGKIGYDTTAGNTKAGIPGWVSLVVSGALSLLGLIFLGLMLFAGVRWMTAQGNEEYVKKAKDTMETAIIGLVLVLAAYAISSFVLGRLGVGGGGETTVGTGAADSAGAGSGAEQGADAGGAGMGDRSCCVIYDPNQARDNIRQCILSSPDEIARQCNAQSEVDSQFCIIAASANFEVACETVANGFNLPYRFFESGGCPDNCP